MDERPELRQELLETVEQRAALHLHPLLRPLLGFERRGRFIFGTSHIELTEILVELFSVYWAWLITAHEPQIRTLPFYQALLATGISHAFWAGGWWLTCGVLLYATLRGTVALRAIAMAYGAVSWGITAIALHFDHSFNTWEGPAWILTGACILVILRLLLINPQIARATAQNELATAVLARAGWPET